MKKVKNTIIVLAATIVSLFGMLIISSGISFAGSQGNSSPDGGGGTPGCYKYKRINGMQRMSRYDDTCFGGLWWEYPVNGNNNIVIPNNGSVNGGTLRGCVDSGAEKYYRLSLVSYNTNDNYSNPNDIDPSRYAMRWNDGAPRQVGLWQVYRFRLANTPSSQCVNSSGQRVSCNAWYRDEGLDWNEVKRKFMVAKEHGAGMDGNNWEDISMFCYSESWEGTRSSFEAWSWANDTSTTDAGPDAKIVKEIEADGDSVSVSFKHQLSYKKPNAATDSNFDPARTDWWVEVREDGNIVKTFPRTTLELQNSGPQRANDWEGLDFLGVTNNYEVSMPEGTESKTVCSKITYTPKYILWDEDQNQPKHFIMNSQESNGQEDSEACIVIKKVIPQEVDGAYASQTTVRIKQQGNDIKRTHEVTTEEDGKNYGILISTDDTSVDVEFSHQLNYHGTICPPETDHDYICDEYAWTNYDIVDESGSQKSSGTHNENDTTTHKEKNIETVTVNLAKGETKRVCRRINYHSKSITFSTNGTSDHWIGDTKYTDTHWKITAHSGDEYSEACATITRPADPYTPSTPDQYRVNGPQSGGAGSTPMYAGETTNLSWETSTVTYDVRRLMQWQAISYQVPVTTRLNPNLSLGSIHDGIVRRTQYNDPCAWFNNNRRNNYRGCKVSVNSSGSGEQIGTGNEHKYVWNDGQFTNATADMRSNQAIFKEPFKVGAFSETVVVPNLVGDKHCNSFGFQFQYYYAYIRAGATEWHKDTDNQPYWTVYDAACRAIAKKPSVAIWNGGLFSGGGSIDTSIARRYNGAALNVLTRDSGNPITFGSWSEYLATINGDVKGFTSGAVLAGSGLNASFDLLTNSPLTIANTPSVGNSNIGPNSVLFGRLQDYLFNQYDDIAPGGSIIKIKRDGDTWSRSIGLGDNMQGTTIVSINGKLTIDQDIKLSASRQNSIYTLPQVVIYAKDGIDVADNVTQIDAWLVTEGELNTCPGFVKSPNGNDTEANVDSYSGISICSKYLQINGPVFAKNVTLNRTYGADGFSNRDRDLANGDARAATAEIFNLSADSYLWAWVQSGRYASSYSEAYSRELPPRY